MEVIRSPGRLAPILMAILGAVLAVGPLTGLAAGHNANDLLAACWAVMEGLVGAMPCRAGG